MEINWIKPLDLVYDRLDANFYRVEYILHERKIDQLGKKVTFCELNSLGKLFTGPFGSNLPSNLYRKNGIPLIRVQNIEYFNIDTLNLVYLDENSHLQFKASEVIPGDILISKAGKLGKLAILPNRMSVANITEHIICFRPFKGEDGHYIACALLAEIGNKQLRRFGLGTILNYLGVDVTRKVKVPYPRKDIQIAIGNKVRKAERLRELVEKNWNLAKNIVESNMPLNLEEKIYKEFKPKDINGIGYNCISIEPNIIWVSPSKLYNRIGAQYYHTRRINCHNMIRRHANVKKLSQIANRISKQKHVSNYSIGLKQIDSYFGHIILKDGNDIDSGSYFDKLDILFSRLAPHLNKVSIWPEHLGKGSGSGELLVYRIKPDYDPFYVFFILRSPIALYQVFDVTSGTTRPRVNVEDVDSILIPLIDDQKIVGKLVRKSHQYLYLADDLISQAKSDVEALIEGTLDEAKLLAESAEIVKENPSPYATA